MSSDKGRRKAPVGDLPIARRLTRLLVLVSAVVLFLTSTAFAAYQFFYYRAAARNTLIVRGQIVAANSTAALAFTDEVAAGEILAALHSDRHVTAAALYDADGNVFATYLPTPEAGRVPQTPSADGYRYEDGSLVGYTRVAVGDGPRLGTFYMATDLGALYETLILSALIGAGVFALSVIAAYFLSRVLQRTISKPILALTETARAVSGRGDYSVRAKGDDGGELGELREALNLMLARIQEQNTELLASEEKLRGHAADLEGRVAERTRDLEVANQELQQKAAELTAANNELDAFAYSVSHDLRAPLRSIDGFSQVVIEDHGTELDEDGRDALRRVRAASQKMGNLIDALLKLARISRVEMHRETVNVSDLAYGVAEELKSTEPERTVEFEIEGDLEAWGDRRLLDVMLDNMIRNSWKYTGNQSSARIEVASARLNGRRGFVVRDNGAGFDMQYADKLFKPFQRLHGQDEFEGTGVGLATVRRIIRRHGGEIAAEGAVGEGAAFYFTLDAGDPNGEGATVE